MKKQQVYLILFVFIIVIMLPLFEQLLGNSNAPFKNLKAEEIESIDLYLQPPNEGTVILDKKNIQIIVDALSKLVVKNEESPKVDTSGQVVSYTLNKSNNDKVEIKISSPYAIIDEKIYKANYEFCDVLNLLGNELLENNK